MTKLIAAAESIVITCSATCALDYVTAFVVLGVAVWLWCEPIEVDNESI